MRRFLLPTAWRAGASTLAVGLHLLAACATAPAAPQTLLPDFAVAPDRRHAVNIQWDDAGYVGSIGWLLLDGQGTPLGEPIALPELNPAPSNLRWLNSDWAACESFSTDNGQGFFYLHAPTRRAYLMEMVAPDPKGDWLFTFASTDSETSAPITTVGRARDSLFPIALAALPDSADGYLTVAFADRLRGALEDFHEKRRQLGWRDLEMLSDAALDETFGAVVAVRLVQATTETASLLYFSPDETSSTAALLDACTVLPLPEPWSQRLAKTDAPPVTVEWHAQAAPPGPAQPGPEPATPAALTPLVRVLVDVGETTTVYETEVSAALRHQERKLAAAARALAEAQATKLALEKTPAPAVSPAPRPTASPRPRAATPAKPTSPKPAAKTPPKASVKKAQKPAERAAAARKSGKGIKIEIAPLKKKSKR